MKVNTTTRLPAKFWGKCLGACIALAALDAQAATLPDEVYTPSNLSVNAPGGFHIAPSETLTQTGQVTGVGPLVIGGGGTMKFANTSEFPNDYTGGTIVTDGCRLELDSSVPGPINLKGGFIAILHSRTLENKVVLG